MGSLSPTKCPQLAEADVRVVKRGSGYDPSRTYAAQNGALRARPLSPVQAPLNALGRVIPFTAPGVVLSVVGGLYERVATRHVDCVGDIAVRWADAGGRRNNENSTPQGDEAQAPQGVDGWPWSHFLGGQSPKTTRPADPRTRRGAKTPCRGARTAGGDRRGTQDHQRFSDRSPARAGRCCQECCALLPSRRRDDFRA